MNLYCSFQNVVSANVLAGGASVIPERLSFLYDITKGRQKGKSLQGLQKGKVYRPNENIKELPL